MPTLTAKTQLPSEFVTAIKDSLGPKGWSDETETIAPNLEDWRGVYKGTTPLLLKPASTEEVSATLKLCDAYNIAITPQGGNTGLVNGGIPHGEVLLSLKRLDTVRSVDPLNNSMVVEAGCILSNVHDAAEANDRFFPLSLGSQGIATIGGLISTNAGGVAVLRYGMMRDLILGLEVVLANGEVWNGLNGLRKNNTGYDLKHLFCGAEGTLGIVTAATLKLFPIPQKATAWCSLKSPQQAVELLASIRASVGDIVTSFEIMSRNAVNMVLADIPDTRVPLEGDTDWCLLMEVSLSSDDLARQTLETALANAAEDGLLEDAILAMSLAHTESFWKIRESIPLVKRAYGTAINHDVSVPVSRIPAFLEAAGHAVHEIAPHAEIVAFGHLGDGNIHYSAAEPADAEQPALANNRQAIMDSVHRVTTGFGGSVSAEHGIGLLKREDLKLQKSEIELNLMRDIKRSLDPKNLLNPGRILNI